MSYSIARKSEESLVKVEVNNYGDYILLDPFDGTFQTRYINLLNWVDEKQKELTTLAEEKGKKYEGRQMIVKDEEGNIEIDLEQITDLVTIQVAFYRECATQINDLFGQDVLKKYFADSFAVNPDFLPDEECIADFLDAITPIMNEVYKMRVERNRKKYNKNRKGKFTSTNIKAVPTEQ